MTVSSTPPAMDATASVSAGNEPSRGTLRRFRWTAMLLRGDPTLFDRWRWVRRHLRGGSLRTLDAGCGSGSFTMLAAIEGNTATGLAFSEPDISSARRRAARLQLDGVDFSLRDLRQLHEIESDLGQFDQILLLECIEHIRNDAKLVADLSRLLRPGGTILLSTPYTDHRQLWGEVLSVEEDGGHVRYGYTHAEIEELFARNGIEVVAREYFGGILSQKTASLQFSLSRLSYPLAWALTFPLRALYPLDGILTRLLRYPFLSIGVVGRKRA